MIGVIWIGGGREDLRMGLVIRQMVGYRIGMWEATTRDSLREGDGLYAETEYEG